MDAVVPQVYTVMLADVLMISIGIMAFLAFNKVLFIVLYTTSWLFFMFVVYNMWKMFTA